MKEIIETGTKTGSEMQMAMLNFLKKYNLLEKGWVREEGYVLIEFIPREGSSVVERLLAK